MKTTLYSLFTSYNIVCHKNIIFNFMIKGGLIRRLSSGIYIWLPNGLRVINNIIDIIKNKLNRFGLIELFMPAIQPLKIWEISNRFFEYGDELFKLKDRNNKILILSPTHEELITKLVCNEKHINFPKCFYQIQNKFRDELRPKLGILRSREFIMKDAYSFHLNKKCLNEFYLSFIEIYKEFFNDINLNIYIKEARCGNIGGDKSHEFYVFSDYGENKIYISPQKILYPYSYYVKKKEKLCFKIKKIKKIFYLYKKNKKNVVKIKKDIDISKFIKTFFIKIFYKKKIKKIFVLIPFNKDLDIIKLYKLYFMSFKIEILDEVKILKVFKCYSFFLGPNGDYKIIADYSLKNYRNFILGTSKNNYLYFNVNWNVDFSVDYFTDLCKCQFIYIKKKKKCFYKKRSFMEVGHIFKLMDKYSSIFCNKNKILMGCYGLGITRIISALIEHNHDDRGIIWPVSVSNFKLGIIPINMYNCSNVYKFSFFLYEKLSNLIEILFDDRKLHIGKMLTDFELIGIPYLVVISEILLLENKIEFRDRKNKRICFVPKNEIFIFLNKLLKLSL